MSQYDELEKEFKIYEGFQEKLESKLEDLESQLTNIGHGIDYSIRDLIRTLVHDDCLQIAVFEEQYELPEVMLDNHRKLFEIAKKFYEGKDPREIHSFTTDIYYERVLENLPSDKEIKKQCKIIAMLNYEEGGIRKEIDTRLNVNYTDKDKELLKKLNKKQATSFKEFEKLKEMIKERLIKSLDDQNNHTSKP
jgi:hypothetical protein